MCQPFPLRVEWSSVALLVRLPADLSYSSRVNMAATQLFACSRRHTCFNQLTTACHPHSERQLHRGTQGYNGIAERRASSIFRKCLSGNGRKNIGLRPRLSAKWHHDDKGGELGARRELPGDFQESVEDVERRGGSIPADCEPSVTVSHLFTRSFLATQLDLSPATSSPRAPDLEHEQRGAPNHTLHICTGAPCSCFHR